MKNPPLDIDAHSSGAKRGEEWAYDGVKNRDAKGQDALLAMQPGSMPTSARRSTHGCPTCRQPERWVRFPITVGELHSRRYGSSCAKRARLRKCARCVLCR